MHSMSHTYQVGDRVRSVPGLSQRAGRNKSGQPGVLQRPWWRYLCGAAHVWHLIFKERPCQVLGHSPAIFLPSGSMHLWINRASDEPAETPNAIAIATMYFIIVVFLSGWKQRGIGATPSRLDMVNPNPSAALAGSRAYSGTGARDCDGGHIFLPNGRLGIQAVVLAESDARACFPLCLSDRLNSWFLDFPGRANC
jgi:hypothetical protein